MPIPDYQSIMLPLLKFADDQKEHNTGQAIEALAREFYLSSEELQELLPSGQQPMFANRLNWAKTYLKKAGLLKSDKRGSFQITDKGSDVLKENPKRIDAAFLKKFPDFLEFIGSKKDKQVLSVPDDLHDQETPEEMIEAAYQKVRQGLSVELLQTIKTCTPAFFERLVIDLLVKMGYGGTRKDAGKAIGKSGDGGIDGIIKEDRLGLDIVYIQAKRWDSAVSRPEIQKFAGALQGQRAKKGIFLTTSSFTK